MFIDSSTAFSASQNAFASGADVVSTNFLDLNPTLPANAAWVTDEGVGQQNFINISIPTAFSGGTSVQFVLQTDTNTNFSTAMQEISLTRAIPIANLTAGIKIALPLPKSGLKRYLRLVYRNVGANAAGAVSANISNQADVAGQILPAGFIVG